MTNTNIGYNVYADATSNVGYAGYNLQLNNSTANASGYLRLARTSGTVYLGLEIASQSRDGIRFLTDATTPAEKVRIDTNGNVGIGTTNPSEKLHVAGGVHVTGAFAGNKASAGGIDFSGGATRLFAWGADDSTKGAFEFRSVSSAGGSSAIPVVITNQGNVGIGTTSPTASLHVSSSSSGVAVLKLTNSDGTCSHTPGASSETTSCSSDIRLKTDITPTGDMLSYLTGLPIKDFRLISRGSSSTPITGVIAQDLLVNPAYSNLVTMGEDGYYSVAEVSSWKIIKAIQDLNTTVSSTLNIADLLPATSTLSSTTLSLINLDTSLTTSTQQNFMSRFTAGVSWALGKLGATIGDGIAKLKELTVDKLTAKKVVTDEFEMKDAATGDVYCLRIVNGDLSRSKGECGTAAPAPAPTPSPSSSDSGSTPTAPTSPSPSSGPAASSTDPSSSSEPSAQSTPAAPTSTEPAPAPAPEPTPTPEPAPAPEPSPPTTSEVSGQATPTPEPAPVVEPAPPTTSEVSGQAAPAPSPSPPPPAG